MSIVKCKYCGKEIDRDIAYSIKKGQYYCSENHYLSALEKKKNQTKHSYKSAEGSDRRIYTDAIQDLYVNKYGWDKNKISWQILMNQTNNLLKANPSWTYETILYIIWYMQEILELNLINAESHWSPLSLVDFYASEENGERKRDRIKEKIRESAFGFCFASSGSNSIGGKSIKNSYVYKARTMGKDTGKTKYKPIEFD